MHEEYYVVRDKFVELLRLYRVLDYMAWLWRLSEYIRAYGVPPEFTWSIGYLATCSRATVSPDKIVITAPGGRIVVKPHDPPVKNLA